MAKEEAIQFTGVIIEILPAATFRVKIDGSERIVLGFISGKMRKHNIKVLLGDQVEIEFSVYDFDKGRITRRHK
jgi:translation initiation factor IF-1